jgi:hypothetical protein
MAIKEIFSKAYELWKRDVLWLILASFVVGIIMFAIVLVASLIVVAFGGAAFGLSAGSDSITGLSVGVIVLGVIIYIVALFLVAAIGLAFYGGVFEMVIGAAKANRPVVFGDLFSGFKKFSSYLVFALVLAGIGIGCLILFVTIIGIPVALVIGVWISVLWLYVLPLIADRGLTFGEAAGQSRAMVKAVGWWKTFGTVILLEVAIWVVLFIVQLITTPLGSDSHSAGYAVRNIIYAIAQAVVAPYAVCYISVMYLGSSGATVPAIAGAPPMPAGGGGYGQPMAPPPVQPMGQAMDRPMAPAHVPWQSVPPVPGPAAQQMTPPPPLAQPLQPRPLTPPPAQVAPPTPPPAQVAPPAPPPAEAAPPAAQTAAPTQPPVEAEAVAEAAEAAPAEVETVEVEAAPAQEAPPESPTPPPPPVS